jgi:hypothetical protein
MNSLVLPTAAPTRIAGVYKDGLGGRRWKERATVPFLKVVIPPVQLLYAG